MSLEGFVPWPAERAERYRAEGIWAGETLDAMLAAQAAARPDAEAVVDGARRWSYAELEARVGVKARALAQLGLQPGDRAVLQLGNSADFLEAFFALLRLGVVPVMALPGHRRSEIAYFVRHARARAYVIPDRVMGFDYRALAREVRSEVSTLEFVLVVGEPEEHISWGALPEASTLELKPVASSAVALLQLSGGSTGAPKLIARTHDDYSYSIRESARICGCEADDRYLVALPAAHNFTMSSAGILGCLLTGGTVVMSPSPDPKTVLGALEGERITVLSGVPTLARAWGSATAQRQMSFPHLRLLQVGGAKLAPAVAAELSEIFPGCLQQVFGMAEGLVCYTRLDDGPHRVLESQGRPMSELDELRVVDEEDREVAQGEVGHLCTRGPYTICGYFDAPDHDRRAFTSEGFYRTGDLVRVRPDGYLIVEGRSKEQVNRGGEKVSAVELEEQLLEHPRVREAAVVGLPDDFLGERVCAALVCDGAAPTRREVLDFLRARGLATYKLPDRVVVLGSLAKTKVGKTDKRQLVELLTTEKDLKS